MYEKEMTMAQGPNKSRALSALMAKYGGRAGVMRSPEGKLEFLALMQGVGVDDRVSELEDEVAKLKAQISQGQGQR